jgi:hypothetical protein
MKVAIRCTKLFYHFHSRSEKAWTFFERFCSVEELNEGMKIRNQRE